MGTTVLLWLRQNPAWNQDDKLLCASATHRLCVKRPAIASSRSTIPRRHANSRGQRFDSG
ncbi:hypothetical protein RISK_003349 [Rhodopirellula islandica]|uniref:Uncharacterized protein n=1 Tax=Rhodopirellula islandica TaxID=595434 RepID=A0A0J1BDP6_RHOIS|nr:hypothetical protein RISK_003349 [Rhodopirellula islandica]